MKTNTIIVSMCFIFFILSFNSYAITQTEWVDAHNKYRRRHVDTPDAVWDSALAAKAQKCADMMPGTKPLAGGWHCNYGENWAGSTSSAESVVGSFWYDEIEDYDYNNPGFSQDTGHFTQVVWKSSTKIGCATGNGSVCLYEPYGNWNGAYSENVKPLKPMGSNILWYHNWGFIGLWYMNGANYASSAWIGYANPSWQVAGAADFDKNGSTDILWRNTGNGSNAVWYLEKGKYSFLRFIEGAQLDWEVGATGDLNKDAKTDILWRNTKTGANAVWYANAVWSAKDGAHNFSTSAWLPPVTDLNFKMVGTGIFK
ncbi:MAG: CAP domain-containing protein [Thermodesulfobacteriota bacterium]|nr:CAP domain-containing protein [Thermodesulfobacteriota bacterium]